MIVFLGWFLFSGREGVLGGGWKGLVGAVKVQGGSGRAYLGHVLIFVWGVV